ncbi:hypothetical protein Tco_1222391 [Tanacetum coccineum]
MELKVNIVTWNYLVNRMLLNLVKNLYVPFGIPFDPKRYYKDGVYTRMLRRPRRQVNRVHILDFEGLTPDMRQDLTKRLRMLGGVRRSMTWRQFILALGLHTTEEIGEGGFEAYWLGSERVILDKGDLSGYWIEISSDSDFLRSAPSYTYIRDPVRRLCHRLISCSISRRGHAPEMVTATNIFYLSGMDRGAANVPYLLAQYLFRHSEGRKSGAKLLGGHFIRRLAHHFGLVSDDGLRGLSIVTLELPFINMGELVKLNICIEVGDDWAWVALGAKRQPVAAAATLEGAEDAPDIDEGAQAVPAPIHAPPPPPLAACRTMP